MIVDGPRDQVLAHLRGAQVAGAPAPVAASMPATGAA